MDEATLTAEAAAMNRRIILEQAIIIRSLLPKNKKAAAAAEKEDGDDVMKDFAKGLTLGNDQLTDVSTELLLTVLLLRLMDERAEGRAVVPSEAASDQQLMLMDAADVAKKKKRAAAAAKKKRYKRNKAAAKQKKAAAKQKKTNLMSSWMGGGLISVIAMVVFGSIATLIFPHPLIHQTDGSGEGNAPPALPPSASKPLRQRNHLSNNDNAESTSPLAAVVPPPVFSPTYFPTANNDNAESTSPEINHPLAAVVPPPIFSPTAGSKSYELVSTTPCLDTPNWKDSRGYGCDWYEENFNPGCMGIAIEACCHCGGGSHTLPPTNSPTFTNSPTNSADPSSTPCMDTPNWRDKYGLDCDWFRYDDPGCPGTDQNAGDMGPATQNCCHCGGGSHTLPPTTSPMPSSSPTKSAPPTQVCLDTPNWKDKYGRDCDWYGYCQYDDADVERWAGDMGVATEACCDCGGGSYTLPPTNSPTITISPTQSAAPSPSSSSPSSSNTCIDTWWKDSDGRGCDWYREIAHGSGGSHGYATAEEGCPIEPWVGEWARVGAGDICCHCGGGNRTVQESCELVRSSCQENFKGVINSLCESAEACSCGAENDVKIVTNTNSENVGYNFTIGLHNECKCDFWSRLCQDTGVGEACDYAAEYCCGDYQYKISVTLLPFLDDNGQSWSWESYYHDGYTYLNSPLCYCDFFNYAQNEFQHKLKPKALNISKEFDPSCGQRLSGYSTGEDDRTSLEAIYEGTNGQNWTNSAGWMNKSLDYCQWYGISCGDEGFVNGIGFVTGIDLRSNNLVGQFPVYTRNNYTDRWGNPVHESEWEYFKHGLANLYSLKKLDLADNTLTGTIEYLPLYELPSLTHFDVSGNELSGEVDALVSRSLMHADFSNNRFTSMRLEMYKVPPLQTLRFCDVSNNAIRTDATDIFDNIPPNIEEFFASNNQFFGSLPESLDNLPELRQLDMSSNALSGELPGFAASILSLQKLDMSNQSIGFTGSIPKDIWRLQSLEILNLAGNKLTGTIPSAIGNMAVLEVFDLSSNVLISSIPSELGLLAGTLKRLGLANNSLSGIIPSQIGQLQGASVLLNGNMFRNSSTAPLSLCLEREVEDCDLANDTTLCPIERNALSAFYDSAKGAEWTDGSLWLDEYASCCNWKGVTCRNNQVTQLNLANNGLSGRMSESIGNLTFIEVMDLSDNDMKGSIPTEIGLLSELTYLRLSYNAFTGAVPEGLGAMAGLQLLQLQSNRITELPTIPRLVGSIDETSAFVSDCGVPSAFDEALECDNCTMCCNENEDCYPQEDTRVAEWGLNYGTFAAVLFAGFIVLCSVVVFFSYLFSKRKNRGKALTMSMDMRLKKDDNYALSTIGVNSVYSYFVTNQIVGWLIAVTTLGLQVGILAVFVMASEANLQDDNIDIQFTWKCPRDSDVCEDRGDLTTIGWAIFSVLMITYLAKDMISGSKLIYHSSKSRHLRRSRIRYFIGGVSLCSISLFAFYISTVYNKAIATSNTEIIVNSVIVLFVMEMDEWIFSALEASNKKWTEHATESEDANSDKDAEKGSTIQEMMGEIALQKAQIAEQEEELTLQKEKMAKQSGEIKMLQEAVQKMQEALAASVASSETIPLRAAEESITAHATDLEDITSDTAFLNGHVATQQGEIAMHCAAEQQLKD